MNLWERPKVKTSQYPRSTRLLRASREASRQPSAVCFSYLSPLFPITSPQRVHDRNALNSFRHRHLRTTFFTTGGWGTASALTLHPEPPVSVFSFQSLTHYPIDYPTRIVVLSERSESKDLTVNSPLSTFVPLSFQQVTTVNVCNLFVLITLQQY